MKDCLGLPLPETYTTKVGALILYSENLAEPSWKNGGRMGQQGHRHRRKPQIKLHALQDLTRAILAYGGYLHGDRFGSHEVYWNFAMSINRASSCADFVSTNPDKKQTFSTSIEVKTRVRALTWVDGDYIAYEYCSRPDSELCPVSHDRKVTKTLTSIFISFTFLTPGALCYTSKPETSSHENLLAPSLYDLISGPESTAKQHQMAIGGYPDIHQGSFTQSPRGNQEFALEERKVEARRVNASMKGLYKKGHSAYIRKDCLCLMLQLHFSYKTNKFLATHRKKRLPLTTSPMQTTVAFPWPRPLAFNGHSSKQHPHSSRREGAVGLWRWEIPPRPKKAAATHGGAVRQALKWGLSPRPAKPPFPERQPPSADPEETWSKERSLMPSFKGTAQTKKLEQEWRRQEEEAASQLEKAAQECIWQQQRIVTEKPLQFQKRQLKEQGAGSLKKG
ncbi:LOW QUALITY PROTEIN: uncharacterized protein KIAA2012 homolog [Ara ararauna]